MGTSVTYVALLLMQAASPSQPASTQRTYEYFDGTALNLGAGVSLSDLDVDKIRCIVPSEKPPAAGPPDTRVVYSYAFDQSGIDKARKVDVRARATGWGASVSSKYQSTSTSSIDKNSIILIITAYTNYGKWELGNESVLDGKYAILIRDDPNDFVKKCGTHYVLTEDRTTSVTAIVRIDNLSSKTTNKLSKELKVDYKGGTASAAVLAAVNEDLSETNTSSHASFELIAIGGGGMKTIPAGIYKSIDEAILKPNASSEIGSAIGTYIQTFNSSNATGFRYTVRPMTDFGLDPSKLTPWKSEKEDFLVQYTEQYRKIEGQLSILRSIYQNRSPSFYANHDDVVEQAKSQELDLQKYLPKIQSEYEECKSGLDIDSCKVTYGQIQTPSLVQKMSMPPYIYMNVNDLDIQKSKAILSEPVESRLGVASTFLAKSGVQNLEATIGVEGFLLTYWKPVFRYTIIDYNSSVPKSKRLSQDQIQGLSYELGAIPSSDKRVWWTENHMKLGLEDILLDRFMVSSGDYVGRYVVVAGDDFGRTFELPLADVYWHANGASKSKYVAKLDSAIGN